MCIRDRGHAVLCAKRAVGSDPFAVLLADDFIVSEEKGVTSDLVSAYEKNSKIPRVFTKMNRKSFFEYSLTAESG